MFGTVLDQKVFEAIVHRCLPVIHEHFAAVDVQLSMASLPWFLSLYINSMPLVFAFRVVDCFFLSESGRLSDCLQADKSVSGSQGPLPDWFGDTQDQR